MRIWLTFDSLLRTQLDQLRPPKRDSTNVCENVVCNDQHHRQKEPYHALKDVVHDEVRLHNDQVERHMCPGELGELELVVPFLERADEEDETCHAVRKCLRRVGREDGSVCIV